MRRSQSRIVRVGFTLIELLVVIAIIGILIGLITAGVMVYIRRGPEALVQSEITQMDAALQNFKTAYTLPRYPPDQLKLCKSRSEYGTTPLDVQSIQFITAMFPNIDGNWVNMDWAGEGLAIPTLPATGVTLEGDQVLVFCLGGPPMGKSSRLLGGFSTNPKDPIEAGKTANRKKFFEFVAGRVQLVPHNPAGAFFPSYLDAFPRDPGVPYIYFGFDAAGRFNGSPNSLAPTMTPYMTQLSPAKFHNSNRCQIISSGVDGKFGSGGLWPPSQTGVGQDDLSNFSNGAKLGATP